MAAGDGWLTPRFLGRKLLVKPPLAMWLSAISHRVGGKLRWPHAAAAGALAAIVYHYTGPVGWLLLVSRGFWRDRAGLVMMDDLLILFLTLAVLHLWRDPKLEAPWSPWVWGVYLGLAVMTKWFAGFLPLALLVAVRPTWRRLMAAGAGLAIVAAPWHLYQYFVNRDWFLAEYVGVELLTYAWDAPVQATNESALLFYGSRLAWLAPILAVAAGAAIRRKAEWLMAVWCLVLAGILFVYGYRNASYLLPLAPALLLVHRGWIHWGWLPLAFFGAFGPDNAPAQRPAASLAGREVLHLEVEDQLRTSLASGATVRYVFLVKKLPANGPLDFERLGVAKPWERFLADPSAQVDAVLTPDLQALSSLIESSPQRDFLLPEPVWRQIRSVGLRHRVAEWPDANRVWLQSQNPQPRPRPNRFTTF